MKTTIKNQIQELKNTASRTGLIFCDNKVMFSFVQDVLLKLEQIEDLIELENEIHLTEVAEAVKHYYQTDTNLTHINIKLQVRPVEVEVKECLINGKLYL
jgi:hypothetical protein